MSYNPLPEDMNGNVLVSVSQEDIFGQLVISSRTNQVSNSFFSSNINLSAELNLLTTGTASASAGSGKAIFQTGTGATSTCSASTLSTIYYTPGYEVYALFTSTWTTPTSSSSSQFIGLWDLTNDGFYVGYNGLTFGIAKMSGGIQTFTPRSSWNGDPLDGSSLSRFTRNSIPEPINLTNLNLFRIRYGWLGTAPVVFEVCSPDGEWITFHTIAQPNLSPNPSIQNPNLPISLKVTKSAADSTNLIISCSCWAAGTAAPDPIGVANLSQNIWSSSTPVDSTIEANVISAGNVSFTVVNSGTISSGQVIFELTPDNVNWFPATVVSTDFSKFASTTYNLALGNQTWQTYVGGYSKARIRLTNAILGSGTVTARIRPSLSSATLPDMVFQPDGSQLHVTVDTGSIALKNATSGLSPSSASVGTTSAPILSTNLSRKGLIITNTSNKIISLGLDGHAAVVNSGITLYPAGTWVMDSYTFTTGQISAISNAAGASVSIQEMQ